MTYETILLETRDGVGIVTLNRPERLNALSNTLMAELDQTITQWEQDEEIKAIIVTGAGEKAFSAGADIHEMTQRPEGQPEPRGPSRLEQGWHMATCKKPTIGAINGLAFGGAALMSSLFDLRIGCERTRFRFLAAAYGRVNSTWSLPQIVGWPIAKELLYTGRVVEAEEALRIGLLNKLVPSAELMKAALEMGKAIAANNAKVVQGIKGILTQDIGLSWHEMLDNESQTVTQS
ncbi:MAG: enoyl-CoA hydratase/isomerase family protein, partial [Chloroflexota bacterium]|nr:enoyl-CoA hydratase/isomerase family protein [Chloroflexota bacterium]